MPGMDLSMPARLLLTPTWAPVYPYLQKMINGKLIKEYPGKIFKIDWEKIKTAGDALKEMRRIDGRDWHFKERSQQLRIMANEYNWQIIYTLHNELWKLSKNDTNVNGIINLVNSLRVALNASNKPLPQSEVSKRLAILTRAGLISLRQDGVKHFYQFSYGDQLQPIIEVCKKINWPEVSFFQAK